MPQPKVTLKIPKPLYEHISRLIDGSGFNSVTDFVVFVLRDVVYEGRLPGGGSPAPTADGSELPQFSGEQLERIKRKLKDLGYL
jgi:hypothetical protein